MSEKLERCPFCGGEVDFWTRAEAEDYQALIIDCKDCPANMEEWVYKYDKNFVENFEKKKVEMFEAWNHRVVTNTNDGDKIIYCKDCKYSHMTIDGLCKYCDICFPNEEMYLDGKHFCAYAEKRIL